MAKKKKKKHPASKREKRAEKKARQAELKLKKLSAVSRKAQKQKYPILTHRLRRWISALLMLVLGLIISLSFLEKAGRAGQAIFDTFDKLIGKTVYFVPLFLFLGAVLLLKPQKKRTLAPVFCALLLLITGIAGLLASQDPVSREGGWLGFLAGWPFFNYFGLTVAVIVFVLFIVVGALIFWEFLPKKKKEPKDDKLKEKELSAQEALSAKGLAGQAALEPKFAIKPLELLKKTKEAVSVKKSQPAGKEEAEAPGAADSDYQRPPLSLFDTTEERSSGGDVDNNALIIQKTFLNFGINVEMAEINVGPTVAQYTLKPAEGVKLSKLTALNNDLALALASHPIRIEAPIPGRSLVGIEVPNKQRANVKIGSLLAEPGFLSIKSSLVLALGRDVMGQSIFTALDNMPHLLVAGATGSGKTICLNALILSLICRNSPKMLRLILIDPKRVEFPVYTNLPHLLTPVIFNPQKAVNALNWLVGEMERRFDVLKEAGSRDIISYNKNIQSKAKNAAEEAMPYIVLVIDELADLMMSKGKEVEAAVVRISQLARAVGIHLIVATQRPSVEVITGLIKANITSRIAFQVASQVDSRTILDSAGSEKLLGRGDMLYLSSEFSKPKRIQGSFVQSSEMKKVVKFIEKENAPQVIEDLAVEEQNEAKAAGSSLTAPDLDDNSLSEPLYNEAKGVVMEYGKASASLLQRRLRIGYARAARILDILEENGVVGPQEGSRAREVYVKTAESNDGFLDAGEVEGDYK